jgi:tRNA (mo5U34)-methyltransferase
MPQFHRLGGALSDREQRIATRFEPFFARLARTPAAAWVEHLRRATGERLRPERHGDLMAWLDALALLPRIPRGATQLDGPCVGVSPRMPLDEQTRVGLQTALDALHPWRKGPFCLHGIEIDAEWRSDWKWARLAPHLAPLRGRLVLDVGCGNGYYGYRALGAGAELVLGIDPTLRFVLQFLALDALIGDPRLAVLPLADTDLPLASGQGEGAFDTVLSMGVLYHRRDAAAHLGLLLRALRPGGELVLETLVLPDAPAAVLRPAARYARMRNVHAVPGVEVLMNWVAATGFRNVRVVDITCTTVAEQRSTRWMRFESLAQCLDPADPSRTVEGHPAPTRALLLAER